MLFPLHVALRVEPPLDASFAKRVLIEQVIVAVEALSHLVQERADLGERTLRLLLSERGKPRQTECPEKQSDEMAGTSEGAQAHRDHQRDDIRLSTGSMLLASGSDWLRLESRDSSFPAVTILIDPVLGSVRREIDG
jgi:hypothetical protein